MKKFLNRQAEEKEELKEEQEFDIIDLDETAGWSKLDVAEELAKQQAANLMEEIGDELAIIDVVEEDIKIEDLQFQEKEPEVEMLSLLEEEESVQAEAESEDLEEDLEYVSIEDDEEEEADEDEDDEEGFGFLENLSAFFSGISIWDKVVAASGIVVVVAAILVVGIFAGKRGLNKQMEAFAPIGEQLETIGVVGSDKLFAVADAKKAMLEAAKLEEELNQKYEEEELSTEIKVVMKMTSVQKDLKIKFVNKKSGKLVGNIAFEVKITDSENKTYHKIDEDKDGIIYMTDLVPGNYSVSMVELSGVEGYSFSTSAEKIKVKETIAYEKIDVTEEIKDQSQVDVSKEDTAQKTETENTLTDTVEWVDSNKKETNSEETYTKVSKDTIADPALSASLNLDLGVIRTMQLSMAAEKNVQPYAEMGNGESNAAPEGTPEGEGNASGETNTGGENNPPATVEVESVEVTPATLALTKGESSTLAVNVKPSNATNKEVSWGSSNESVATVSAGTVTAVSAGTAQITATAGGKSATCTITVKEAVVSVSKVALSETAVSLKVGEEKQLSGTVEPANATNKTITWSSSNPAAVVVDGNGKVKAVAAGTSTITATAEGQSATCAITVTEAAVLVNKVSLSETAVSLKVGEEKQLSGTVEPANATNKKITWSSSNPAAAVVDGNGKVKAVAAGTSTITATPEGQSGIFAKCEVTVLASYDPKKDTTKALKDKSGNQIYVLADGKYVEAKVADYYKYDTFYKKEKVAQYTYTGWQNIDGKTYYFDKNGNKVTGEQVIQGAKYSFNSDGSLNNGSGILGIDVSTWNGNIDWNKVKNSGVSYVIIRTGFRGSTQGALVEDNKFRQNIQGATNAGLKVGVYFFSQAINEVEAVEEASMVLSQVKGYKLTYPVFIDVEPSGGRADSLSSDARTKVINAFCQTIQNGGYRAGIYANKTWLNQKMNISALSGYKIWLAQYNSTVTYGGRYDMWQYSSKGSVSGISGKVDMNLSYLSY